MPTMALAVAVSDAASLQQAIQDAQPGDTITLQDNISLAQGITIDAGKHIILDLNGKTISGNTDSETSYAVITNKGNLTIQDSTDTKADGTGSGMITSYITNPDTGDVPGYASNTITNHGTLTVKSGKIVNNGAGYACFAIDNQTNGSLHTPVLNIEGGRMVQNNAYTYAVRMFCSSATKTNTVNISGGVIEGGYGLWLQIPNGSANMAKLTITDGTINARDGFAMFAGGNGQNDYSKVSIDISGGTINGTGVALQGAKADHGFESLSVTGGTFTALQTGANLSGFISGGVFKNAPAEGLIAEGYERVQAGDKTQVRPISVAITDGADQTWTKGTDEGIEVVTAASGTLKAVKVNGKTLDAANYLPMVGGDNGITLLSEYLETLPAGTYTLDIVYKKGTASTTFTVKDAYVPHTGDAATPILYLTIMLLAAVVGVTVYGQRRKA